MSEATRTNSEVAQCLEEIADLLEIDGANPFRIRAYRNAAKKVRELEKGVLDVKLTALGGIGADLAGKITELCKTGTTQVLDEVRQKWPPSARALMTVDGLGPKRTKLLVEKLNVRSIEELKQAVAAGALAKVPGLGGNLEKKLVETLKHTSSTPVGDGRFPLVVVQPIADDLVKRIRTLPGVIRAEAAGSLRRKKATVGDLDIVVCAEPDADRAEIIQAFTRMPGVRDVLGAGDTKGSVKLMNGLQVDMRVVDEEAYGAALLYFTGNKNHSIELRAAAIKLGFKLNEYGVYRDGERIAGLTEEEMYAALGMPFLPPEQRER